MSYLFIADNRVKIHKQTDITKERKYNFMRKKCMIQNFLSLHYNNNSTLGTGRPIFGARKQSTLKLLQIKLIKLRTNCELKWRYILGDLLKTANLIMPVNLSPRNISFQPKEWIFDRTAQKCLNAKTKKILS